MICYLRRQDLWIESDFKQHIKCQVPWTDDIYALIERQKKTRTIDYHWMVSNWARFAGVENVSVVPLNKSQDPDYPMRRFLEFIGIQNVPAHRLQTPAQNVSPPAGLIEAARHVKRSCMHQGFSAEKTERAVNKFLEDAATRITAPNRLHLMTTSERVQLVDHYADSNKRLADEFLGGAPAFESVELLDDPDTTLVEDSDDVLARYAASHALAYQRSNPTRIMRSVKTRLRALRTRF